MMKRAALSRILLLTAAVVLPALLATYVLGGFEGLGLHGTGALIAGVLLSVAVAVTLMVLMFSSSRGHDEAAHYAARDSFKKDREEPPPDTC